MYSMYSIIIIIYQYKSQTFLDYIKNDSLNEEIIELRKQNQDLIDENDKLRNELELEKSNNQILNEKIKELEKKINEEKEKSYINHDKLINDSYYKDKIIMELHEELKKKDKKIEEQKEIISKFPFTLEKNEKLLSLIFISVDQKIHYSLICKNTDYFSKIETILYNEYPEYKETQNYFIFNGIKINKYKTLEENKIKNNDIITLKEIEVE